MSQSIDEPTSQSTTDHQSESSSVNAQSPSFACPAYNLSQAADSTHHHQDLHQSLATNSAQQPITGNQQQQHSSYPQPQNRNYSHQAQDSFPYPHPQSGFHPDSRQQQAPQQPPQQQHQQQTRQQESSHHHNQQQQQQQQQQFRPTFQVPPSSPQHRRAYTGVDKLILAAMLNESAAIKAAAAAAAATSEVTPYMGPSGRGIGYIHSHDNTTYYAQIPAPSNKSEWELFCLLDRANLLSYYGTFLNFGGDDVQQLCDADEEEFLEIMGLVGMTHKPLHVRRLQRALIEWREVKIDTSFRKRLNFTVPPTYHTTTSNSTTSNASNHATQTGSNQGPHQFREPATSNYQNIPIHELGTPVRASTPVQERASAAEQGPPINESSSLMNQSQESSQQSYDLPHELHGAPKRLKLMDDLHRKLAEQHHHHHHYPHEQQSARSGDTNADLTSVEDLSCPGQVKPTSEDDDGKIIEIVDSPSTTSDDSDFEYLSGRKNIRIVSSDSRKHIRPKYVRSKTSSSAERRRSK